MFVFVGVQRLSASAVWFEKVLTFLVLIAGAFSTSFPKTPWKKTFRLNGPKVTSFVRPPYHDGCPLPRITRSFELMRPSPFVSM